MVRNASELSLYELVSFMEAEVTRLCISKSCSGLRAFLSLLREDLHELAEIVAKYSHTWLSGNCLAGIWNNCDTLANLYPYLHTNNDGEEGFCSRWDWHGPISVHLLTCSDKHHDLGRFFRLDSDGTQKGDVDALNVPLYINTLHVEYKFVIESFVSATTSSGIK
jgi:hypothetical protein